MYRSKVIATALCSGVFALCINHADAQEFTAKLNGFNEIGSISKRFSSGSCPLNQEPSSFHLSLKVTPPVSTPKLICVLSNQ